MVWPNVWLTSGASTLRSAALRLEDRKKGTTLSASKSVHFCTVWKRTLIKNKGGRDPQYMPYAIRAARPACKLTAVRPAAARLCRSWIPGAYGGFLPVWARIVVVGIEAWVQEFAYRKPARIFIRSTAGTEKKPV